MLDVIVQALRDGVQDDPEDQVHHQVPSNLRKQVQKHIQVRFPCIIKLYHTILS